MSTPQALLNSLQAHMIGFAFSVVLVLTTLSAAIVMVSSSPRRPPLALYDLSRVIRGEATVSATLPSEVEVSQAETMPSPSLQVEQDLSQLLAKDLALPSTRVAVFLDTRTKEHIDFLTRQIRFSKQDARTYPIIYGDVSAAVQRRDGRWDVYSRQNTNAFQNVWQTLGAGPWIALLLIVPFSMWFSTKIARPVRNFSLAASKIGTGRGNYAVPEAGPTEIRVAAKALNDMQARIRHFLNERTALVGAIAHDLKSPLNSLRFRLANAPDEVRHPAELDIAQMSDLIDSVLDYAESDGKLIICEKIDLFSLIGSIIDDHGDHGHEICFEGIAVEIWGDISMLRRLFINVIDNAVKYGSSVKVSLGSSNHDALIEVTDNGPGMDPQDLSRAFEPFFRGERSRSRATGGIGLGLAIARSVVAAHQGAVELANITDGGFRVRVSLPLTLTQ